MRLACSKEPAFAAPHSNIKGTVMHANFSFANTLDDCDRFVDTAQGFTRAFVSNFSFAVVSGRLDSLLNKYIEPTPFMNLTYVIPAF
jgi:hypothetical protein